MSKKKKSWKNEQLNKLYRLTVGTAVELICIEVCVPGELVAEISNGFEIFVALKTWDPCLTFSSEMEMVIS